MNTEVNIMKLLAGAPRMLFISFMGQTMGYILYNALFEKRRSMWKLIVFVSCKTILIVIVDVLIKNLFSEEDWTFWLSGTTAIVIEIFLCVMFMYTFYGGLVKCITGMMIGEAIISFIWLPGLVCVNAVERRKDLFMIYGKFQIVDILFILICGALFAIFYYMASPLLKKFRTYKVKHTIFLGIVYAVYFSAVQGMPFVDMATNRGIAVSMLYPFLTLDICIMLGALTVYWNYRKNISEENDFLKLQLELMEVHYTSIQSEIQRIKGCQQMIKGQMDEIIQRNDSTDGNKRTAYYLESLKKEYNKIGMGIFCRDWLVDTVLYYQSEAARTAGIETECQMREYRRENISERGLAQLLFLLFDFGIRINEKQPAGAKKRISIQIGTALNVFSVVFFATSKEKMRIPRRQLQKYVRAYNGIMTVETTEEGVQISLSFYESQDKAGSRKWL